MTIGHPLPMLNQPSQQIHLCDHRHGLQRLGVIALSFRNNGRRIPFKEPAQRTERRVPRKLDKFIPFLLRPSGGDVLGVKRSAPT